jgi:hypothetical protein
MRRVALLMVLLCGTAIVANAQIEISGSARCGKSDVRHTLQVPDRPSDVFGISQYHCTWPQPMEILGLENKEGVGTQSDETIGDSSEFRGIYVDTMSNGDKLFYRYEGTSVVKEGRAKGKAELTFIGGTGRLKGIKGKGGCTFTSEADGSSVYDCKGEYQAPE